MGENGGRTTGQLLSHGPCACLAWCLMSLAHIQCVGTAGLAVSDDGNGRCRKTLEFQGKYSKDISNFTYRQLPLRPPPEPLSHFPGALKTVFSVCVYTFLLLQVSLSRGPREASRSSLAASLGPGHSFL